MKRILMVLALLALSLTLSLYAQEESSTTFLDTTPTTVSTPSAVPYCSGALTFDLEAINDDGTLDVAFGKAVGTTYPDVYGIQDYNNGSGGFPNQNGTFFLNYSDCNYSEQVNNLVFGKLRSSVSRKDLAFLSDDSTYIFLNSGDGMSTPRQQALPGAAKDGSWGPFNHQDNYNDLAVTNGSSTVKIYSNNNDGTLSSSPTTVSMSASRVILAQMNKSIYLPNSGNMWDLVSVSGSTLSIRLNDNSSGFNSPDTISIGSTIYDLAVGDLNNDGFNDVVVAINNSSVRLYLNDTTGTLIHTPAWTSSAPATRVAIGDLGGPSDASKNDGWDDIFVSDLQLQRKIFINQRNGSFSQEQTFSGHTDYYIGKILLADVQNTGGLSLVFGETYGPIQGQPATNIKILKHVGDPAPAPPKNVQITYVTDEWNYRYPKVTWAVNKERDLLGYHIWRKITGICGNGNWYLLDSTLSASTWEYTDWSIGTVGYGSDCTAEYKLKAKDAAYNLSDYSSSVSIDYSSSQFKAFDGNAGSIRLNVPIAYAVHTAYPNPFNPSTEIKFDLPEDGFVTLNVFDVLGRKVGELVSEYHEAGYHTATWNANNVASGVYFARFTATDANGVMKFSKINKLILSK